MMQFIFFINVLHGIPTTTLKEYMPYPQEFRDRMLAALGRQ